MRGIELQVAILCYGKERIINMNTVLYILISLIVIIFLTFLYIQYLERESDKKRFNDRLNIDEKWRNK
jgi:heme/copper-type cytochrome/quinol oxidase subunit 2